MNFLKKIFGFGKKLEEKPNETKSSSKSETINAPYDQDLEIEETLNQLDTSSESQPTDLARDEKQNTKRKHYLPPNVTEEELEINYLIDRLRYVNPDKSIKTRRRIEAIDKLGLHGQMAKKAIPFLIEKLFDKNKDVREHTQIALINIDKDYPQTEETYLKIPFILKKCNKDVQQVVTAQNLLMKIGVKCQNYIIDELKFSTNYNIHINLFPLLYKIKPVHKQALPILYEKLNDGRTPNFVQQEILTTISQIGVFDEKYIQILSEKLDAKNTSNIRTAALDCLANCKELSEVAIPHIIRQLDADNIEVRSKAIDTLVEIGEITIPYLIRAIKFTPTYTKKDQKEILHKLKLFWNQSETVRHHGRGGGTSWVLKELLTVANRPIIYNESIFFALMKLGFDVENIKEVKMILEKNDNQREEEE